jgi:hypothetical protein
MALERVAELVNLAVRDSGVLYALKTDPGRLRAPLGLTAAQVNALRSAEAFQHAVAAADDDNVLLPAEGSGGDLGIAPVGTPPGLKAPISVIPSSPSTGPAPVPAPGPAPITAPIHAPSPTPAPIHAPVLPPGPSPRVPVQGPVHAPRLVPYAPIPAAPHAPAQAPSYVPCPGTEPPAPGACDCGCCAAVAGIVAVFANTAQVAITAITAIASQGHE